MDDNLDTATSLIPEFLKICLPLTISGATLMGLTLHDWTYVFTIIYTLLGIVTLVKKHWLTPKNSSENDWLGGKDDRVRTDSKSDSGKTSREDA